jgi:hypothetical protein
LAHPVLDQVVAKDACDWNLASPVLRLRLDEAVPHIPAALDANHAR